MAVLEAEGGRWRKRGGGVENQLSQLQGSAGHCTQSTGSQAGGEVGGQCEALPEVAGEQWRVGREEVLEGRLSGEHATAACNSEKAMGVNGLINST